MYINQYKYVDIDVDTQTLLWHCNIGHCIETIILNKVCLLQNPYLYQEAAAAVATATASATIPSSANHNAQHLYLPTAGPVTLKQPPSSSSSLSSHRLQQQQQQLLHPTYVDDKITKNKQPQKITKNVYVTPLSVDVVIPQHSYQLNSDVHNNEVSE